MLRELFLNKQIRKNVTNRIDSGLIQYSKAKSLGIFFNMSEFDYENIKTFVNHVNNEGKETSILGYTEKLEGPVLFDSVVKREITSTGTIKSVEFQEFVKKNFDFLIVLSYSTDITFDYLISMCKAKCKVGLFSEENEFEQFDLQLKTAKGSEIEDLIKYIQKID